MKSIALYALLALAGMTQFSALASARVDPRILEKMREEKRTTDRFCMSFGEEPIGNGGRVASECLMASANRYRVQALLAERSAQTASTDRDLAVPQYAAFCAVLGDYAGFGSGVATACRDWNRERSELVRLALDPFATHYTRENQLRQVEALRRQVCLSLQNAGNRGRGEVFWRRISACFTSANFATSSDRAIVLEDF